MPKPNYRLAKKQKEQNRAARQLEKQRRRSARANGPDESVTPLQDSPVEPGDPTPLSGA